MISCRPSLPRRPHLSSTLANAVHRNAQLQSSPSAASEISVTPSKSHQLAVTDKIRCLLGPELFTICTKRDFENSPRTKLELRTRVENESRMNSSSTPCGLWSYSMGFKWTLPYSKNTESQRTCSIFHFQDRARSPRVFCDEFVTKMFTKFGDEFSESPNLVKNLVTKLVTNVVMNCIRWQKQWQNWWQI